jgi:hypothetical protein
VAVLAGAELDFTSSSVSGSGSITVQGGALASNKTGNAFAGTVTLQSGTLKVQAGDAFGTAALDLQGGTLQNAANSGTVSLGNPVTVEGSVILNAAAGLTFNNTVPNTVHVATTGRLTVHGTLTFNGPTRNDGKVTAAPDGHVLHGGNFTMGGGILDDQGTVTSLPGGVLEVDDTGLVKVSGSGVLNTDAGSLISLNGSGELQFKDQSSGTIAGTLDPPPGTEVLLQDNANLTLTGTATVSNLTLAGNAVLTVVGQLTIPAGGSVTIQDQAQLLVTGSGVVDDQGVTTAGITVTSDHPAGSVYGQSVVFTAIVGAGGSATYAGALQFQIDGHNVGAPVPLSNDSATYSTTALPAGSHTISAFYAIGNPLPFVTSTGSTGAGVTPAPLSITADDQSKVYGAALPPAPPRP